MPVQTILDTAMEQRYWNPNGYATTILPPDSGTDSCMYGPERAVDGDPRTAWCEGAEGNGEGEILVVPLGNAHVHVGEIEIWSGFGRSDALHTLNGRPRTVRLYVIEALSGLVNQFDTTLQNFVKLAESEVCLEDLNDYQRIELPDYSPITDPAERRVILEENFANVPEPWLDPIHGDAIFVAIEIVDVYEGTRWQDTLISEVRPIVR